MKIVSTCCLTAISAVVVLPAFAQSSVTLYGLIDEGFDYNSNAGGKPSYSLVSGSRGGSRFGLRGEEDLGNGLKAIFTLENGFDLNSGKLAQGGLLFGRQAYVGLESHFGTITLGRQYDTVVEYVQPFAAGGQSWAGTQAAHPGDIDNLDNSERTNNAIKYTSLDYGGFKFGGLYSFGGIAGSTSRNQVWSLGARYTNGPLGLGVGYLNVRNPNVSFFGGSSSTTLTASTDNIGSPVFSGYASANTYQVIAGGGAYTFGAATIGAVYSNVKFIGLGNTATGGPNPSGFSGTATFNSAEINFRYYLTPVLLVGTEYNYTRGSSIKGQDPAQYNQGTVSVIYSLSKRTDLYVMGAYQKASGVDSTGKPAVADINVLTASSNNHQAFARAGIYFRF